jgi:hypothetical protein
MLQHDPSLMAISKNIKLLTKAEPVRIEDFFIYPSSFSNR